MPPTGTFSFILFQPPPGVCLVKLWRRSCWNGSLQTNVKWQAELDATYLWHRLLEAIGCRCRCHCAVPWRKALAQPPCLLTLSSKSGRGRMMWGQILRTAKKLTFQTSPDREWSSSQDYSTPVLQPCQLFTVSPVCLWHRSVTYGALAPSVWRTSCDLSFQSTTWPLPFKPYHKYKKLKPFKHIFDKMK